MKRLIQLVWDFIKIDFHLRTFGLVLLWTSILIGINYSLRLEDDIIDILPTNGPRFLAYLALYSIVYYTAVLIVFASKRKSTNILTKQFWLISSAGIIIFAADSGFVIHQYMLRWINPTPQLESFSFAILSNASEFLTIALPLFLINYCFIPTRKDNLGFNKKETNLKAFFLILVMIAPFIFLSAFEQGLNNYYPTFRYYQVAKVLNIAIWIPVSLYEIFYGLNFINVELMFRGFMVIGLASMLGREAVLPVAVLYCSIHFGKPLAEAISSIFGGYILGAIAYQTRSVWGGVIVHMGLAWLMELSAFIAKSVLKD